MAWQDINILSLAVVKQLLVSNMLYISLNRRQIELSNFDNQYQWLNTRTGSHKPQLNLSVN